MYYSETCLEAGSVLCQPLDPVESDLDLLLPNGVVAPGVVVARVLLARDHLTRVKQVPVCTRPHLQCSNYVEFHIYGSYFIYLVNHRGLEVHKHGPGHVLAPGGLGEEGVEGVVSDPVAVVLRHGAVRVNTVLQAVQLPWKMTRGAHNSLKTFNVFYQAAFPI